MICLGKGQHVLGRSGAEGSSNTSISGALASFTL